MEEAEEQLPGSPSEQRQEQRQEEQRPAVGQQEPVGAGRGSDEAEEEAEAGGAGAGAPAAAPDTAGAGLQATPLSLPTHLPEAHLPIAEGTAEQPVTAEPPRKRVRFSEGLEEAQLPSGGQLPAEQGMPALPPLPQQLARAAHGLAAAGALGFGEQATQNGAGEHAQGGPLQLLRSLMAQANQQQQQQQQQRAASPSLSPWLPRQAQQAQQLAAEGAGQAAGRVHGTVLRALEDVAQVGCQTALQCGHGRVCCHVLSVGTGRTVVELCTRLRTLQ